MAHQPLECTVRVGGVGGIATTPPTRTVQAHCAPWCTVLLLLQPQQLKLLPNPPSEARTRCEVDEAKSTKQSRARRVRLATLQCFSKSNNPARDQQNRQRACMNKQSGTQLENVRFLEKPAAQQQSDTTEEAMQAQYTDTPV